MKPRYLKYIFEITDTILSHLGMCMYAFTISTTIAFVLSFDQHISVAVVLWLEILSRLCWTFCFQIIHTSRQWSAKVLLKRLYLLMPRQNKSQWFNVCARIQACNCSSDNSFNTTKVHDVIGRLWIVCVIQKCLIIHKNGKFRPALTPVSLLLLATWPDQETMTPADSAQITRKPQTTLIF